MMADRSKGQLQFVKSKLTPFGVVEHEHHCDDGSMRPDLTFHEALGSQGQSIEQFQVQDEEIESEGDQDGDCDNDEEYENFQSERKNEGFNTFGSKVIDRRFFSASSSIGGYSSSPRKTQGSTTFDADRTDGHNIAKCASRKNMKKKKVCHFCGRNDTPMWRRGPSGKGTLCNACGVKWSNSLKGGRKSIKKKPLAVMNGTTDVHFGSNVSPLTGKYQVDQDYYYRNELPSSPYMSSPSDLSQPSSPDHYPMYFQERRNKRMKLAESNKRWDVDVNSSSSLLLGHLLSVVKDRVLEEQEIEEIKKEIHVWKSEIYNMEMDHKSSFEEHVRRLTSESNLYNEKISHLFQSCNSKVSDAMQNLQNGVKSFTKEIQAVRMELSQTGASHKEATPNSCLTKIESLEEQILQMTNRIERSLGEARYYTSSNIPCDNISFSGTSYSTNPCGSFTPTILSSLKAKQLSMMQNFEQIRNENATFEVQINNQFNLIENVFARSQERKIPS